MLLTNYILKEIKFYTLHESHEFWFANPFRPYYLVVLHYKQWWRLTTKLKFFHRIDDNDNHFANEDYLELKEQLDKYFANVSN